MVWDMALRTWAWLPMGALCSAAPWHPHAGGLSKLVLVTRSRASIRASATPDAAVRRQMLLHTAGPGRVRIATVIIMAASVRDSDRGRWLPLVDVRECNIDIIF